MKHTFSLGLLAAALLVGCGSDANLNVASITVAPVNTQIPSAPLSTAQTQQVSAALAKLTPDTADTVLSELAELQATVGFNVSLAQAVGVASLVQAGMDSKAASAAVQAGGAGNAISQLVSFAPGADGKPSLAFEASLAVGSAALDNLVPPGVLVSSLSASQQTEVGVASTLQTLRLMNAVLGKGNLLSNQSATEANAAVAANFSAERKTQLETAVGLLIETAGSAKAALSDGTARGNATMDALTVSLTNAMADRSISAAELQGIVAAMQARGV